MYCYQRIRDLREDADLKQKDLAAQLQITSQQYSLYERGDREIPFHHVITLAKFYGVSIDYIAGLTNNKNARKQGETK
ncbi:MAG: helix-turn-helix transcriptional regulator [Clostridia bacterium]|nr:helix-turn-helix transcriptional regulator [Clostridia bacterium]